MNYVIGVDGGGTKTTGALADKSGKILARFTAGPSNYHVIGKEALQSVLAEIIDKLTADNKISKEDVGGFFFGLAGIGRPADFAVMDEILGNIGIGDRSAYGGDMVVGLYGGAMDTAGVIVMAGTGSIIYGVNADGEAKRAGGWGHILGDEGSGYALGLAGVRAVTMIHDGRHPASVLKERVLAKLGLQSPDELVKWIHGLGPELKETVGQAGPVVLQAAEEGDKVAMAIVDSALNDLVMGVSAVLKGLDMTGKKVNIVLAGGVFDKSEYYNKNMAEKISKAAPNAKAILPICQPVVGGLIGAMAKMGIELNDDIRSNLQGSE